MGPSKTIGALFSTIMLLTAAPVAAQEVDAIIADAVSARAAGNYSVAIAKLESADRIRSDDPTILRLLGTTHAFAGAYTIAIQKLQHAQALSPRDIDITFALANAYLWAGRHADARNAADAIAAMEPGNPDLPDLTRSIDGAVRGDPGATRRPQFAVSQSVADVRMRGAVRTWNETVGSFSQPVSDETTMSAEVSRENRSDTVDTHLQLRLDRRLGVGGWAYIAVSSTPNADFRERWGIRGGGEAPVSAQISLTLDLRYAEFVKTKVAVVEPGLRLHASDERFSIAVKSINLWGDLGRLQSGWALRAESQFSGIARLFAGGATYPDTEAAIVRRLRSAFFGVTLPIGDRSLLRATLEHENRSQTYTRNSAVLGMSYRF